MVISLRRGCGVLAVGACLLHGPASAGDGGAPHRLLYLFDPRVDAQAARAEQLAVLVEPHRDLLEIVGIVRTDGAAEAGLPPLVSSGDSPAFETLTADGVLASSRISDEARKWLRGVLPQRGDFFAFDTGTGIDRTGTGEDARDGLAGFLLLMGAGASTEVDFSTWGKVKELFR